MDVVSASSQVFRIAKWIIVKAQDAKVYKETCKKFAEELKCLDMLQENLDRAPAAKKRTIQQPLVILKQHLESAVKLVKRCSSRGTLYNVLRNTEKDFLALQANIQMSVTLLLLGLQCHDQDSKPSASPPSSTSRSIAPRLSGGQLRTNTTQLSDEEMVSARSLAITWGNDSAYWRWVTKEGSNFSQVAYLAEVVWLELNGSVICHLVPGTYTLSWRLQMGHPLHQTTANGWDTHPVEFSFSTKGGQGSKCKTLLQPSPQQSAGCNIRNVEDGWKEFDIGEFKVDPRNGPKVDLTFSMKEVKGGHWKRDIFVDGVVIQLSSDLVDLGGEFDEYEEEDDDIPDRIIYSGHDHSLELMIDNGGVNLRGHVCDECHNGIKIDDIAYRCYYCDFDVHIECADNYRELQSDDEVDESLEGLSDDEFGGEAVVEVAFSDCHDHPLSFRQCPYRNGIYECDVCGDRGIDASYACLRKECSFDAHPQCVL